MKVVCFGDSLTSCGGVNGRYSDILQDRFPGHTFVNRGAGGESLVEARTRLETDVLSERPDIAVVEFGANDWWQNERSPAEWAADLAAVLRSLRAQGAQAVVAGVFGLARDASGQLVEKTYGADERSREYRRLEAAVAEAHGCAYVPNLQQEIVADRTCWRDRNHPNEHGNRAVADQLQPLLERLLGQKALPIRQRRMLTTRDMWDEAVALAGNRLAAVCGDRRLTYAQAEDRVCRLAAGLVAASGAQRPKVAVFLPNCLEYFLAYWATVKLGGIIVPLNTWLRQDSLDSIFETVAPDVLIVHGKGDHDVLACAARRPGLPVFALRGGEGFPTFASLFDHGETVPAVDVRGEDPSIIMHTSGTTAAPKGAVMRHSDLVFNVMTTINAQGFTEQDVHLLVNPMFHCTALYSSLPAAACQKTPVIITADTSPDGLLRLIERERITTFLTVPSVLQRITVLPTVGQFRTDCLRVIGYAGSFMPVKTVRELQRLFPGVELHNFFGLTETISATHSLDGDQSYERPDSIGRLLPFVEALIVDEVRQPMPAGTVGELLFARENVIKGYWNRPGKLEESLIEVGGRTWFNTGDLAAVDADGFFFIKGRKKDMIIVGGENVFAAEVEAVLMNHEKVKEAAVKGIPATGIRESLGEMIKAYIVPDDPSLTEVDIRRHCHKLLPSYKIPHVIVFLDALPRNPSGKVVKDQLT
jgi:acyl-CoA synthetase (AMP-forming)/AMP-acid ligase II/lysophospholipase L1-like esterase